MTQTHYQFIELFSGFRRARRALIRALVLTVAALIPGTELGVVK